MSSRPNSPDAAPENPVAPDPPAPIGRRALFSAIAWTSFGRYAGQMFRWGTTFFVARILSPGDYGLVGMTTVLAGFIALMAEFGVGTAALKMRHLDRVSLSRLNGLSFATGLASMLLGWASAVPVATFFGREELVGIVGWSSVGFVLSAVQTVPTAILQRDLSFRRLALVELWASVLLAALVLTLAMLGFGYWALVFPPLVVNAAKAIWLQQRTNIWFKWPELNPIREAAKFGAWAFAGRASSYAMVSSDFLVVGRVLGESALGQYSLAWDIANAPNDQVNGLVARVSSAFYSALQDNRSKVARLYQNLLTGVATISVPMVLGLAAVAPEFVYVVLGEKWSDAITILQILCVLNAFRIVTILAVPVLQMMGEVRYNAMVTIGGLFYLPLLFFFGAQRMGPDGVAWAWLIGYPPILLLLALRASRKLELAPRAMLSALTPPFLSSLVMVAAVSGMRNLLAGRVPMLAQLTLLVVSGAVVYCAVYYLFFRDRAKLVIDVLKRAR